MPGDLPLYENDEFRAITKSEWKRDSSVMMSSVMPSVKYSCSASPLMFKNGKTAMEGLSGNVNGTGDETVASEAASTCQSDGSHFTLKACTGRSMFFRARLPRSSKVAFTRPVTASWTVRDIKTPPGG